MILTTILAVTYCLPLADGSDTCVDYAVAVWQSDSVEGRDSDMEDCMQLGRDYYNGVAWECKNDELTEKYNNLFK